MNPEAITAIAGISTFLCLFLMFLVSLLWKYPDLYREERDKHKISYNKLRCLQKYVAENRKELDQIKSRRKAEKLLTIDSQYIRETDMAVINNAMNIAVRNAITDMKIHED